MHIVLVSCCEKKAIKRTRSLLDSYARRTGDRTWLTPITTESLSELHKALRKSATRQTSVACFRNDGMKRMRLLWTVGNNKNFDKNGTSPIATKKKKTSTMPEWARICALIAETAGFMHDLGKFNQEFQHKLTLTNKMIMDNVRHEWLSMFLADSLIKELNWTESASLLEKNPKKFSDNNHREETLIFKKDLESVIDSLLYCIATHHKLPSREKRGATINNGQHVRHKKGPFDNPKIPFSPSEKLIGLIQRNLKKIKELDNTTTIKNPAYWRAIATFSRMALILADQSISAINHPSEANDLNPKVYANTTKTGCLNQDLSWHLENVGIKAGQMVFHMLNIPLPHLSQDAIDQINKPSNGSYEWQNRAAFALSNSRTANDIPHLVLNMAGTGSGKTRMNLRAICALNENKSVRVATALNLRTLTLQTNDAYHKQVKISKDEMACVIGDSLTQKLHEIGQNNVDEDESEYSLDVNSEFDFDMPDWLKFYSGKNPKLSDIIGAPILVSTIDFLIAGGEPHRKHHHILAAIRVMHSDLILDEIDGYEPTALLSVLRLVTMSAMFGRNVVASSATLSKPVAKMLWQAYDHGAQMRGLINKESKSFKTTIIDDLIKPHTGLYADVEAFMESYICHVKHMMLELRNKPYRVPVLAKIDKKNSKEWLSSIEKWAKILHQNHSWIDDTTGKRISIGLIRIANVDTAVKVAEYLSHTVIGSRIACYHSNHFLMQRYHIEKRLDFLLTRNKKEGNPNQHILDDKEIRQILNKTEGDVQFIVVATPVEEIGRDHDFDWAIVEPSSSQSIVQTAGRVNRHRRAYIPKNTPNVALLQYCYRELNNEKTVFTKPGLEIVIGDKSTHLSHDLSTLFNWSHLNQIDAKMRFCSEIHKFAEFDDNAIESKSKDIFKSLLTDDHLWMAQETYTESSLRSSEPAIELCLIDTKDGENFKVSSDGQEEKFPTRIYNSSERVSNDWLVKTDDELFADAEEYNVEDNKKTMTVSISYFSDSSKLPSKFVSERICRHRSFGFYISDKKT